jgi:hypothetical protein
MRRLYFMLPDVDACRRLVVELRSEGISDGHLHAIASDAVPHDDLPEASMLQTSEFTHGIERGLGLGGVAGLLGGVLAISFPPAGLILGGQALLMTVLAGAGFGAIVSGMVAKDIPKAELNSFQEGIALGKVLLMVDVPKHQTDRWKDLIKQHHPEAEIGIAKLPKR